MSRLQEIIGDRYPLNDALKISRDLRTKDIVRIIYEGGGGDDCGEKLSELLDIARDQAEFNKRWPRKTIPNSSLSIGLLQITPNIPIPFTGHERRKKAERDLKRLDRLQSFQEHAELVKSGQYEMAQLVLRDLISQN
jgi:hypothetical protein